MEITIAVDVEEIGGYLAEPDPRLHGPGPWPAVVILHDIVGLSDDDRVIAERFAQAGYLAVLPDLYSRGGALRCIKSTMKALRAGQGQVFRDVEATRLMLEERQDCTGRIGVVGFCMSGGFALLMATRGFDASAPYYGEMPADESVLDGACPVVASFGGRDPSPGMKGVAARLETALSSRDIPHDVKEYPRSGHSFANRYAGAPLLRVLRIGYQHEDSEDAWRRVLAFFATHLKTAPVE